MAEKVKRRLVALSTALGAMANIEAIMNELSDKDRGEVADWFKNRYLIKPGDAPTCAAK